LQHLGLGLDVLTAGGNPVSVQSSHSALSRSVARAKEVAMPQTVSTSITRRSVVAGLALAVAPVTVPAAADNALAQDKQSAPEKSLYERLGGVFAIAAVVDHFSDAVVKNPVVGQKSKNPQLREWHTKNLGRLPGLKFMRTLWVCNVSGGSFQFPPPSASAHIRSDLAPSDTAVARSDRFLRGA
jgi:hypothetical protein